MSLADLLVLRPEFRIKNGDTASLDDAIEKIEAAFPGIGPMAPADVDAILARVTRALRERSWKDVTTGDVAAALYVSFVEDRPLADDLRRFLDAEAQATTKPRLLDALARAYLDSWSADSPKTAFLQRRLVERSGILPQRWQALFRTSPDFLDLGSGPKLVGNRMVSAATPYQWLRSIGIAAPHGPGFMRLAHKAFLKQSPDAQDVGALDKLLSWAIPDGAPRLDDLGTAEVVDRILSPWTSRTCPINYREPCLARLIDRFGDPRHENPAFWALVSEPHRRLLNKWLAKKSMEAMFEVVSEVEHGTSVDHWPARRRFWMGLYEAGRIDEAWFALGDKAVPVAEALFRRTNDKSYRTYGRQASRADTCLLFMQIGGKTLVEGSHNFRIHIFPTPMRTTPQLYATRYELDELLLPFPHNDARMHSGDWMGWVEDRIRGA
ncbi:EH signature domain-containing protein [Pacificispira sp.]|uniref:EH signature domain-containing protein n=1 Tax=Pacificispira sp. TaxID=2888761 RepID=UPI003B530378